MLAMICAFEHVPQIRESSCGSAMIGLPSIAFVKNRLNSVILKCTCSTLLFLTRTSSEADPSSFVKRSNVKSNVCIVYILYTSPYCFVYISKPVAFAKAHKTAVYFCYQLRAFKNHSGDKLYERRAKSDFLVRILRRKNAPAPYNDKIIFKMLVCKPDELV